MQASCPIPFRIENLCNLSIDELSGIERADALFKGFHVSRRFVAADTACGAKLLMGSGLPVDLPPYLSMSSLAIDNYIADDQAEHLFAVGAGGGLGRPDGRQITAEGYDGVPIRFGDGSQAAASPGLVLFLNGFDGAQFLFPLPFQRASHQPIFRLDGLILPLSPFSLIARSLQAQIPLFTFGLFLLLQVGKGCQGQRQLIRTQCFQEALLHLCIQSDGSHFLTRLASKLALVVVADIHRELSVWTRVAQMQEGATIATAHDPLQ